MTRRVWISNQSGATAEQMDRAIELVGCTPDDMDKRRGSLAAALAVVQAQDRGEDVPDDHWRKIKLRDLELVSDDDDDQDFE